MSLDMLLVKQKEEEQSLAHTFMITASLPPWKTFCGGYPPTTEKDERRTVWVVGGAERADNRMTS